jgi:hypothetical protein
MLTCIVWKSAVKCSVNIWKLDICIPTFFSVPVIKCISCQEIVNLKWSKTEPEIAWSFRLPEQKSIYGFNTDYSHSRDLTSRLVQYSVVNCKILIGLAPRCTFLGCYWLSKFLWQMLFGTCRTAGTLKTETKKHIKALKTKQFWF